ncbi:MAG: hypothetical protein RL518_1636 [Pseudomonadota bacterium]
MERTFFALSAKEGGFVALDALWGLLLGSLVLVSCAFLSARVSSTAATLNREIHGRLVGAKVIGVITGGLFSLDRNRQPFGAHITSGRSLRLMNGARHPLAAISSLSGPSPESDILTLIDIDTRYRGTVTAATISGSTIQATVCGLPSRIASGAFKSYLLFTLEGARQVVGEVVAITSTCARLTGSSISGIVSAQTSFPSRPLTFVPIDREYSLFVDRIANLRLASHTGATILENQPVTRGVDLITIQEENRSRGIRIFTLTIQPSGARPISHVGIPALTQRNLWNEALP